VADARDGSPLRIVIEARLASGQSGGVEGVVIGLAAGLSGLEGDEEYLFTVWPGLEEWLAPHVAGPARLARQPRPPRYRRWPTALRREINARLGPSAPSLPSRAPAVDRPSRDEFLESLHGDVVHFPFQRGYLTDVPTIYHPHDLQHLHLPQLFSEREREQRDLWYGTLSRQAAMVAVASNWTKADVEQRLHLPPYKVRVVPLAPPLAAVEQPSRDDALLTLERLGLPRDFILYPAQTWAHKNHEGLLRALRLVRDRDLPVPLVAPGAQNAFFPELRRLVDELELADQVFWPGFVSQEDLRSLFSLARAVVIPSRFEAGSAPLWEAFLAGVPAAVSNVTSLPAQAGDAAIVFNPNDPEAIADAVVTLWRDEAERTRLVKLGRERVREYTWDRTARTFRAHYRRLANRALTAEDEALLAARASF
jgi:glycosyltransferase involved in cell wall biosynthesis